MAAEEKFALMEWMKMRVLEIEHEKLDEAFAYHDGDDIKVYMSGVLDVCSAMLQVLEEEKGG